MTTHDPHDPTTWDLEGAVIDGNMEGVVALIEAIRRYGAKDVELGYDWPGHPEDDEPGSDAEGVTWYAVATFPHRRKRTRPTIRREVVARPGFHHAAQVEALAEVVRALGGHVALVPR